MNLQTFTAEGLNNARLEELRAAAKSVNADRVALGAPDSRPSLLSKFVAILSTRPAAPAPHEVATSAGR